MLGIILEMIPVIIILFMIGLIIVRNSITMTDVPKIGKILSFVIYGVFAIAFAVGWYSMAVGYKKLGIICFIIVAAVIAGLVIAALFSIKFDEKKKIVTGRKVVATLVDYKVDPSADETDTKKYNAVFMYSDGEPKYYVTYETYELEKIKEKLNLVMEIIINKDRCNIVNQYVMTDINVEEAGRKVKKINKTMSYSAVLIYTAIRLPIIIGIIIADIIVYSYVGIVLYIIILAISGFLIFKQIKNICYVFMHCKNKGVEI